MKSISSSARRRRAVVLLFRGCARVGIPAGQQAACRLVLCVARTPALHCQNVPAQGALLPARAA
jgi:hypothetical protein